MIPALENVLNLWVLATLVLGLVFGFLMGRAATLANISHKLRKERGELTQAAISMLSNANKLNEDVEQHNADLEVARSSVSQIGASVSPELAQARLLAGITQIVESNRRFETELDVGQRQLRRQAEQLDEDHTVCESKTDAMSSLSNRKAFDEVISDALAVHRSRLATPFALMLIDIDHFKRINDTFGQAVGDRVLVKVGEAIAACVRPDDSVFRLSGDEFAAIFPDVAGDKIAELGQRVMESLGKCSVPLGDGQSVAVSMSLGLTVVKSGDTAETIYIRADDALYQSKDHGRNRLTTKVGSSKPQEFPWPGEVKDGAPAGHEYKLELMGAEA